MVGGRIGDRPRYFGGKRFDRAITEHRILTGERWLNYRGEIPGDERRLADLGAIASEIDRERSQESLDFRHRRHWIHRRPIGPALVAAGEEVTCLARRGSRCEQLRKLGARVVKGDVIAPESLGPAVTGADIVYHVAGLTRP